MLVLEMLLTELRDRILFQRADVVPLPQSRDLMLLDPSEPPEDAALYVGRLEDLPAGFGQQTEHSFFFCTCEDFGEIPAKPAPEYRNLILFSLPAASLHNRLTRMLRAHADWEERLASTEDLKTLTLLTAEKSGCPLAIVNSFFQCVAISDTVPIRGELLAELRDNGRTSYDRAMTILPAEKTSLHTDRIFFREEPVCLVDQVIRQGDKTAARILMECPEVDDGLAAAYLDDLVRAIRPRILNDQSLREYFTDAVSMFIGDIIDQKLTDPEEIEQRRILSPDMVKGSHYHPIVIKFRKQAQKTPYNYITGRLKQIFTNSSVASYNNGLVVLAAKNSYEEILWFDREALRELLEQFDGYAGIGDCTEYLTSLRSLYIQAAAATRLGRVFSSDPSERIFNYCDYYMYFMVDLCVEAAVRQHAFGNISYLCQPGVLRILQYDHQYGTQLTETLRSYIANSRNATCCADKLGIHRNTVNYRIRMIEDILGFALDDTRSVMNVAFSLYFIDYEEKYLGCDPLSTMGPTNMPTDWDEFISMTEKQ